MSQPDYEKALKQIETGDLSGALHSLDRILKKKSQVRTSLSPQSTSARKIPGFQRCVRSPIARKRCACGRHLCHLGSESLFSRRLLTSKMRLLITRRMADALTIVPFGCSQSVVADGRIVKFDLGWVQSLAVKTAVAHNIQVAIGDRENRAVETASIQTKPASAG
jgi:hypothetical protein